MLKSKPPVNWFDLPLARDESRRHRQHRIIPTMRPTIQRCKNCGRYFAQTGRVSAECCERPVPDGQQHCRDIGALKQWTLRQACNDAFKVYRKEYKRRFAWIKAGRISDEDFYAWSEQARA